MTKKRKKKKIGLCLPILVIVVIIFGGLFFYNQSREKIPFYSLESRLAKVENTHLSNDGDSFDVIGWLRVQNTNLDLPIIYKDTVSDFPVELESYVWHYQGDGEFHNLISIMGHNIFNLSTTPSVYSPEFKRFEELMSFVYFDEAKESKYIQLTFNGKEYLYKIFSVALLDSVDVYLASKGDYEEDELDEYIKMVQEKSFYQYNVDVNGKDNVISLSTCTRFLINDDFPDIVVSARMVREGEEIKDYAIKENPDNYNKIKEMLKGDEEDEQDSV